MCRSADRARRVSHQYGAEPGISPGPPGRAPILTNEPHGDEVTVPRSCSSTLTFTSSAREIVALGDFNMPKREPGDPILDALARLGLELPEHSSEIGSNLQSDKHYDQIAFFPGDTKQRFTGRTIAPCGSSSRRHEAGGANAAARLWARLARTVAAE